MYIVMMVPSFHYFFPVKTIAGNSLTPHATLLVRRSGTIWTVINLQGQKNDACESRPGCLSLALSLVCLDSARVWLSCQAIKWIANPVTNYYRRKLCHLLQVANNIGVT